MAATPVVPAASSLLEVSGLTLTLALPRGGVPLVSDVSLSIGAGEKVGLVGESGSGKSLLALSLIRLLPAGITAAGSIRFDGRDLLAVSDVEMRGIRGARIGIIFQEPTAALNPVFDLESQLVAAIRAHAPLTRRRARDRAVELLQMAGIRDAGHRMRFYPHQLSGGLCQRAMIAMALAGGARLLIADEPTTSLDVTVQEEIVELLDGLARETGIALLFISHDLGVVAQLCDRIAVAYAGQLVEVGAAAALLRAPTHPYTQGLVHCVPNLKEIGSARGGIAGSPPLPGRWSTGCRFSPRCSLVSPGCDRPQALLPVAGGRMVRCWKAIDGERPDVRRCAPDPVRLSILRQDTRPLMEIRDLAVTYRQGVGRSVPAVDDVSFDIARGRTLALIGESGSGKSTVARAICGLGPVTAGTVSLNGTRISGRPVPAQLAGSLGVQVVSQDPGAALDPRWPLWRSIVEPRLARFPRDADGGRIRAGELLERVGLDQSLMDRRPHQLSGGQRQRVTIARALSPAPQLVILDEAVSAVDVSVRNEILVLLGELQRASRLTYLLISHDIGAVTQIADDVAVLYLGRLAELGPAAEVLVRPLHPYTRALIRAVPTIDGIPETPALPAVAKGPTPVVGTPGCAFRTRCPHAITACHAETPKLQLLHRRHVACHRATEFLAEAPSALTA